MGDFSRAEGRMWIDGHFVDAKSGAVFDNVNPATEEVIGRVADGGPEDMDAAIAAARRAFDETTWSTDHSFRRRCLEQFQQGLEKEKEHLRLQTVKEVGAPIQLTYAVQGDSVIRDLSSRRVACVWRCYSPAHSATQIYLGRFQPGRSYPGRISPANG